MIDLNNYVISALANTDEVYAELSYRITDKPLDLDLVQKVINNWNKKYNNTVDDVALEIYTDNTFSKKYTTIHYEKKFVPVYYPTQVTNHLCY